MPVINHHALVFSTTQTTVARGTAKFSWYFTVAHIFPGNPVTVDLTSKNVGRSWTLKARVFTTSQLRIHLIRTDTTTILPGRWFAHIWRPWLQTKP